MATRTIAIDIPESVLLAETTDERLFARELRMLAAVKLFELGRLSSGRAAELAGMVRVEFLLQLNRYQVFPLEAELSDLERGEAVRGSVALPGGAVAEMEGVSEQLVAAALECWDEEHFVQLLSARRDEQAPPSQSRTEFWRTGKVKSEKVKRAC